VQKWIATAKHKYYLKMKSKFNDPEDIATLQDELSVIDNKYQMVLEEKKKLLAFFDENKKNMLQLNTQNNILLAEKEKNEAELVIAQGKQKQLEVDIKQLQARANDEMAKVKSDNEMTNKNFATLKEQHKSLQAEMERINQNKSYIPNNDGEKTVLKSPVTNAPTVITRKVETPPVREVTENPVPAPAVVATPATIDQGYQSEMQKIRFYTVKSGDTLTKISKQFYGTTKYYRMIMDENKLGADEENKMKPGAVLKIPPLKNN
jgi:nucleoid-associated protein YgaU